MKMITIYDPPSGWLFGFPKEYKPLPGESFEEMLLRDGYPQQEIDVWKGLEIPCRFWEQPAEPTGLKHLPTRFPEGAEL